MAMERQRLWTDEVGSAPPFLRAGLVCSSKFVDWKNEATRCIECLKSTERSLII